MAGIITPENREKGRAKKPYNTYKQKSKPTFDGQDYITYQQDTFIDYYIQLGNQTQAAIKAGYSPKSACAQANYLLKLPKIAKEISHRAQEAKDKRIADGQEVLEYFTAVMRGEIKDQFGLDAPLGERTRAAQELAKRSIDVLNRPDEKNKAEVVIKLDWGEDQQENNDKENTEE